MNETIKRINALREELRIEEIKLNKQVMEKKLSDHEKLITEYQDLNNDYEAISLQSAEVLRIAGYYKKMYHEYREKLIKIMELFEKSKVVAKKDIESAGLSFDKELVDMMPMSDKNAEITQTKREK